MPSSPRCSVPGGEIIATAALRYFIVAVFAAILAAALGLGAAWMLTMALLDVDFSVDGWTMSVVIAVAIVKRRHLGAGTILGGLRRAPARLLRALGTTVGDGAQSGSPQPRNSVSPPSTRSTLAIDELGARRGREADRIGDRRPRHSG